MKLTIFYKTMGTEWTFFSAWFLSHMDGAIMSLDVVAPIMMKMKIAESTKTKH
jgi:hypothetical protein